MSFQKNVFTAAALIVVMAAAGCGGDVVSKRGAAEVAPRPSENPAQDQPVASADPEVILPSGETSAPVYDVPIVPEMPSNPENSEEPVPPAGSAQIQTFHVEKVPNAALSTYHVTWQVAGAKAAYVWGNAFNRLEGDTQLSGDARCSVTSDGRYLAVNADGNKLIAGSPNFEKFKNFSEGLLCDNSDALSSNDCLGSPAPEGPVDTGDENNAPQPSATINPDALAGLSKAVSNLLIDPTPACRIGLKAFSGDFYTRALATKGKICLAVQSADDSWAVQCRGADAPKAALVESDGNVSVSTQKPVIVLDFNYVGAASAPDAEGCQVISPSQPGQNGGGRFKAECPIKKDSVAVTVTLKGFGHGNKSERSYRIDFAKPTAEMKLYGTPLLSNTEGEMKLQYLASRAYTITDLKSGAVISAEGQTCPWVNGINLYGQYVIDGQKQLHPNFKKVEKASDAQGVVTVYRDAYNYFWSFGAKDFEGMPVLSNVVGPEQTSEFSTAVTVIEGTHQNECSKKVDWVLPEDRRFEKEEGPDGAQWLAYGTLDECGADLNCYLKFVKWSYNNSHTVGFVLNVTNVQSLDVECKQAYSINIGTNHVTYDQVIKTDHQDGLVGHSQIKVSVTDISPVIACNVVYRGPGENGVGIKEEKINITDSCVGYDYGYLSLVDVKGFLIGRGVASEDIPF